jgi:hypothetical protein
VNQLERGADMPIPQSGEPSRPVVRQFANMLAKDVYEQKLGQLREHGLAAGLIVLGLVDSRAKQVRQPPLTGGGRTGVQQARQRVEERIEGAQIASEIAANEVAGLETAGGLVENVRYW